MPVIHTDVDLRRLTTFHLEARCDTYIEYSTVGELAELRDAGLLTDYIHIGEGANLLFTGDFHGTVLASLDLSQALHGNGEGDFRMYAANGNTLDSIIAATCSEGLWGLENLSGIPGKIGGAVVQNVGAYGVELKDVIESVNVFDTTTGEFLMFRGDECEFGYRWSMFKRAENRRRYIITGATFRLSRHAAPRLGYGHLKEAVEAAATGKEPTPLIVRETVIATRNSKLPDPAVTGSAGSFFKNPVMTPAVFAEVVVKARQLWGDDVEVPHFPLPDGNVKVPAAWFIDRCGWKGKRQGGAAVWEKQPLVLVNLTGNATPADVLTLQERITDDIFSRFGIKLSPEVEFV